ncbi:hypothetical protein BG015_008819 [Linnemannia schmuckeri]|uniref:DUF1168-domain-containing protein n=1 Tax=Linnemannia schmuckeri TaxID=64567 RepID=A0A9P5RZW3_9FUNG|nr:hypothetical protein BG015_008819 [Linnemannia schmuckeri]
MSTSKKHTLSDDESTTERTPIKHHLTPLELQKKQLDKLLEKIDKPVRIPERPRAKPINREPKDYVKNIQGSSAGAGSGDFHVYRAGRRREYARLKQMDEESKEEREQREYEEKMQAKRAEDEEKTEKNRNKRQRRKQRANNNRQNKKRADARSDDDEEGGSDKEDKEVKDNKRSDQEGSDKEDR